MTSTFPFEIATAKTTANPARQFAIVAHAGALEDYHDLFEDFGFTGSGASWREHIETIIEEFEPELLDHVEFDEVGDTFLAYADSPAAVKQFLACVQPYFGDIAKLEKYFQQTDPEDFFQ